MAPQVLLGEHKKTNMIPVKTDAVLSEEIKKTLERLQYSYKKANRTDLELLFKGINNRDLASDCAFAIYHISREKSGIFLRKDMKDLLEALNNENAFASAFAISSLAHQRSDLLIREDLQLIKKGLENRKTATGCAAALSILTERKPDFAELCMMYLIKGLESEKSASACATNLLNLHMRNHYLFTKSMFSFLNSVDLSSVIDALKNEETANDSLSAISTIAEFHPELILRNDITSKLIQGLENKETAEGCASALSKISIYIQIWPWIFRTEHIPSLIKALRNKKTVEDCATVLARLAFETPTKFTEEQKKSLFEGYISSNLTYAYAGALSGLKKHNPKSFESLAKTYFPEKAGFDEFSSKIDYAGKILDADARVRDIRSAFSFLEKHPEEFQTLWNKCGIRYFDRYSEELLVEAALNTQDPKRKQKSPSALLIYTHA
ncbi:hypothetical protein KJ780_03180, partial [Candidatus Micrarchaeota archaeon]|nr:hypothetical protein [Candidatus Micrarchaeota archaeon]